MQAGVVITGRGMASSLALDAVNACAAARAGVVRATPIEGLKIADPETGDEEPVAAHQAVPLTSGFEGFARLLRLTHGGLEDLARNVTLPDARVAAYLALPPPDRLRQGLELIDDEVTRKLYAEDPPERDRRDELWRRAVGLLAGTWPAAPGLRHLSALGHAGLADCIVRAAADLSAGVVDAAIVGGVDSLVDGTTVGWLNAAARLKTAGRATGLMPGEAGAFLLLERTRDAKARGVAPLAEVHAGLLGLEASSLAELGTPVGKALGDVLVQHAGPAGWASGQPAWLVSDMNGEDYRALDLGHALTRLRARFPSFAEPIVWMPALSFGDTASASGAVAVNTVLSAFARGYAPSGTAVIACSSDGRERAAVLVRALRGEEVR